MDCERILLTSNLDEAKAIGREVLGLNQALWDDKRFEIVANANLAKFSQDYEMREFLIQTGKRVLVEESLVDKVCGIVLGQDKSASEKPNTWKGLNC